MSFQNFDTFQNQHTPGDASAAAGAPNNADNTIAGQGDPSTASFQGPNAPEGSGASVPPQGGDGKTTLWYVTTSIPTKPKPPLSQKEQKTCQKCGWYWANFGIQDGRVRTVDRRELRSQPLVPNGRTG